MLLHDFLMTIPASIGLTLCLLSNVHLSRIASLASNLCSHRIQKLFLKAQLRVAPKYLLDSTRYSFSAHIRPLRSLDRRDLLSSLLPGLGQLWLSLGLSLLFVSPCGIVIRRPLA